MRIPKRYFFFTFIIILLLSSFFYFFWDANNKYKQELASIRLEYSTEVAHSTTELLRVSRRQNFMLRAFPLIQKFQSYNLTDTEISIFVATIYEYCEVRHLDPWIPISFAAVESGFNKNAVSNKDAKGIFQFMDSTAKEYYPKWKPGDSFSVIISVEMWFLFYDDLMDSMTDSTSPSDAFKWLAIGYIAGHNMAKNGASTQIDPESVLTNKSYSRVYLNKILTQYEKFKSSF